MSNQGGPWQLSLPAGFLTPFLSLQTTEVQSRLVIRKGVAIWTSPMRAEDLKVWTTMAILTVLEAISRVSIDIIAIIQVWVHPKPRRTNPSRTLIS